jgi:outer membrane protein OmpA-like peptidoglycan-associated protein
MKKLLSAIILLLLQNGVKAQRVEWAYRVLEFSSQKEAKKYSSQQILGRPNVLPKGGENELAWQTTGTNQEEYIRVLFSNPLKAKYIMIGESYHAGNIKQVIAYDMEGKGHEIPFNAQKGKASQRLLIIPTDLKFLVSSVKVVIDPLNIPVGLDAIGISDGNKPYELISTESDVAKANIKPKKISKVNSLHPEMGPIVSPDGNRLYFSRVGDPKNAGGGEDIEDIWYSDWDSVRKEWSAPKNMTELNNKAANYINSISPDGNTMLLGNKYLPNGKMEQGVSLSRKTETGWSKPKPITIEKFANLNDNTDFYLSSSGKFLVMSIEQNKDAYGDRDLYVSVRKNDTVFGEPLNLGMRVNTKRTEANPFLASDDKTLYFASDGFAGYGGADIYMTRRLDDTWLRWTEPENLGPIVNTSFNEMFFSTSVSGDRVFYTSGDPSEGDLDIYSITLPKILRPQPVALVKGKVVNSKTGEPLTDVRIFFEDLNTGKEMGVATSDATTGEFQIALPSGSTYGYLAEKPGFLSVHANIDLSKMEEYNEVKKNLLLAPIEAGQAITVNNIFFDANKTVLKKESYRELIRLIKAMNDNPGMHIEISAYADDSGSDAANLKLSEKRTAAVSEYLEKNGIDKNRITVKAYGRPKAIAVSEEVRQQNRRIEFKIVDVKLVKG